MAITQALCSSFKAEILLGVHDLRPTGDTGADTFKIALFTSTATINANSTAYAATNEVTGTNYTAGGNTLTNLGVVTVNETASDGTGYTDFTDTTWANSTITARGAMIYNSTPSTNSNADVALVNAAVAVLDFGTDQSSSSGDFTIVFPTAANTSAIIRIT
tara:strand:+ start:13615 stop:14097 length:483 start_codon:yes stop_codon:yes gene_type:complete